MGLLNRLLERERIDRKLAGIFQYPLSIITAPIGYGKTTAARLYLNKQHCAVAWVPLSHAEAAPALLWEEIVRQMEAAGLRGGDGLRQTGYPDSGEKIARLARCLAQQAQWPAPFLLVLDDFQQSPDPGLFQLFKRLALEQLPGFYILLLTRDLSRLDAAALYQKGLCFTLTEKALRFREEEICQYGALLGLPLQQAQVQQLLRYADGWIGMLVLIMDGMRRGLPIEKNDTVRELLEQNVYSVLSREARDVLLKLCALDDFPASLAASALGQQAGGAALEEVLRNGAITVYDEVHKVYRLHHLMRDFLAEREGQGGNGLAAVRKRAGGWYLREGDKPRAFHFFLLADDMEAILRDLNEDAREAIPFAQYGQIREIAARTDEKLFWRYPLACLRCIYVLAMCGAKGAGAQAWDLLLKFCELLPALEPKEHRRGLLRGEAELLWSLLRQGSTGEMLQHGRRAQGLLRSAASRVLLRDHPITFGSPQLLYLFHRECGRLGETAELLARSLPALSEVTNDCGVGCDSVIMAEYALETGDFEQAELHAYKGIYKAQSAQQPYLLLCAHFALCRLALLRGNRPGCQKLLGEMQRLAEKLGDPVFFTALDLTRSYLYCCLGEPREIAPWVAGGDSAQGSFLLQARSFYDVVRGKALLLKGDSIILDAFCETAQHHLKRFGLQLGLLHNLLHAALAKNALGGADAALPFLEKALDIGFSDHIVLPFAENGGALLPLLERAGLPEGWAGRPPAENVFLQARGEYLAELSRLCRRYSGALHPGAREALLTPREVQILALLAKGQKHAEISRQLFISVTTVRYHIQNIYQKFGVNNKVLAIEAARGQGYL